MGLRLYLLIGLVLAFAGLTAWALYERKDAQLARAQKAQAEAALEQAAQINAENARQFSALQAEKAAAEKLLAERLAKKTADARRLNALIDAIQAAEPSNA